MSSMLSKRRTHFCAEHSISRPPYASPSLGRASLHSMFLASSLVEPVNRAGKRRVLGKVRIPYEGIPFEGWLAYVDLPLDRQVRIEN